MNPYHITDFGKLYYGDCLGIMAEAKGPVDMILCDLPYGTTACKWDAVIPFEPLWEQYKRLAKKKGAIVLTGSQPFTSALVMSNAKMFKHEWIWKKNRQTCFASVKYRPLSNHENVIVFGSGAILYNPQKTQGHPPTNSAKGCSQGVVYHGTNIRNYNGGATDRFPLTVIEDIKCERGLHPTQKPVALFEYMIRTYTNEGDIVLDNCAGSGTTAIACINTHRRYILIEKEEKYCEITARRIDNELKIQREI